MSTEVWLRGWRRVLEDAVQWKERSARYRGRSVGKAICNR